MRVLCKEAHKIADVRDILTMQQKHFSLLLYFIPATETPGSCGNNILCIYNTICGNTSITVKGDRNEHYPGDYVVDLISIHDISSNAIVGTITNNFITSHIISRKKYNFFRSIRHGQFCSSYFHIGISKLHFGYRYHKCVRS